MAISVVYGIPGSGKGYYLARAARYWVRSGRRVYATCAMDGARPLRTIVDCLAPVVFGPDYPTPFRGCYMVIDEAGSYFDARLTVKDPLPPEVFSALTLHRKGGIDIIMACQSIQFLDVQVRRVTGEYIKMERVGADATRRLVSGKVAGLPFFQRPIGFWATAYSPEAFSDKMELLGSPEPLWRSFMFWRRSIAESYDTTERVIDPQTEESIREILAGSDMRGDAAAWRVRRGHAEQNNVRDLPVPARKRGLVF